MFITFFTVYPQMVTEILTACLLEEHIEDFSLIEGKHSTLILTFPSDECMFSLSGYLHALQTLGMISQVRLTRRLEGDYDRL